MIKTCRCAEAKNSCCSTAHRQLADPDHSDHMMGPRATLTTVMCWSVHRAEVFI